MQFSSNASVMLAKLAMQLQIIDRVNLHNSEEEALLDIKLLYQAPKPVVISFINAHAYNLCCTDATFFTALLSSDLILRDGIGMHILFRALGKNPKANLNGTDFIPEIIELFKGKKIALFGSKAPYAKKAAERLSRLGHTVALYETGYCQPAVYLDLALTTPVDIIILGMGMPIQEKVSLMLKENLEQSCLIINGGAILDFWGNKMHRAPKWLRKLSMEWIFRLLQEPRRLFSRYIIGNYIFLKRVKILKKSLLYK